MARTRQTARKSTNFFAEAQNNMCGVEHNRELLEKLIQRNCIAMMKNSLQNVVQEDRIDIQTKYVPYRDCLKLARLWILKDLLHNHNNPIKNDEIGSSLLTILPMDVKTEIISYIPTFSNVYGCGSYSDKSGALRKTVPIQDPWYFTYIKHRLISQSVRSHLEELIFKRMQQETLDLSVFLSYITPKLYSYRVKVVRQLLIDQNMYLIEKRAEHKYFNLPSPDPVYEIKERLGTDIGEDSYHPEHQEFEMVEEYTDLISINSDELDSLEKTFIQELSNQTIKTPFQTEKTIQNEWKLLDSTQSVERKEIHSSLSYYEPFQHFYEQDEQDEEDEEDEDILLDNKKGNEFVKSVRFSITDRTNPSLCADIIMQMRKIERVELEMYEIYEGNRNLMTLINRLTDDILNSLESVTITYFEKFSTVTNQFSMLRKLSSVNNIFLKLIIDSTDVTYLSTVFPDYNIHVNNTKLYGVESVDRNIFISSINVSDVKESNNPWYALKTMIGAINSSSYPMETKKEIVDSAIKRYPPIFSRLDDSLDSLILNTNTAAILQYIIYLTNTYHNGELFLSVSQPLRESTVAFMILSGWDISNQILQIFGKLGPDFAQLLLEHWSQLLKQNICKLDIIKVRSSLAPIIAENRNCRMLAFICDHCSPEEKVELFKTFQYGQFGKQYLETSLVNIMCDSLDEASFSFVFKYIPPESFLEISQKVTATKTLTSTSLLYLIENVKITNETISALIEAQPLLVHISDNEGITPLHLVCRSSSRWNLIPLLLKYNVHTQAKDSREDRPLEYLKRQYPSFRYIFPYLENISQK